MKEPNKLVTIIIAIFGFLLFSFVIYTFILFQPVSRQSEDRIRFTIPRGQAISIIGQRLAEENLIRNPLVFRAIVKLQNLENKIQAGSFELSQSMSPVEIANKLTEGTNDLWVTIPEGWRREEIAESLAKLELESFDQQEFLLLTAGQEGMLFPDSYLVPRQITTESLVNLLMSTFDNKVLTGLEDEIEASDRDFDDILTMASIVEREARGLEDMEHVAGILWNRVDIGMALQADATLQYVKGYDRIEKSWWSPPLGVDKEIASPFNTYKNAQLPPHPIASPGIDAIRAALEPLDTDNFYYLHDRQGQIHYGESLEDHQVNVNRYLRN